MAWNPLPPSWFANWAEDGTNITVPIATFPELTAAEADATAGDIRKVLFAICDKCWSVWSALVTADRPSKMTLSKSVSVNAATGIATNTFTFTFQTLVVSQDVAPEV